ncbi:snapalysin family zinc-dependent metalloprotease [Streptomyces sp. BE20]|uniref:snapalysin family zinc-dependent metalloprotease n=1 Tax=unclassified Streptomyces TaxID=2593676 RepID=UPI002E792C18|nr:MULTISPECIES: snapalysin family zinc-dependent metalloprotease [unclassified Streptomyces]MED7955040.1 snapalysin family zinc-dependent metalloprotease [Streptomyces sp. BE303]MEE1821165.1 snapalysin family zinc-dependent metalloprotease [Streptomyces sp. BE20]
MSHSKWFTAIGTAAAITVIMAPAAQAVSTPDAARTGTAAVTTLYYDATRAAGWEAAVSAGVASWNANTKNVKLVAARPGTRAEIQIVATTGWPQATLGPVRPGGQARVELGNQAVTEGHDKTRIAAHEIGHNLGLPDTKPGPCSQLMSGSSAGTTCKNAVPNAAERSRVESAYAGRTATVDRAEGRLLVDAS